MILNHNFVKRVDIFTSLVVDKSSLVISDPAHASSSPSIFSLF